MMNHFHWMVLDNVPSKDFDVYISGAGTYNSPEKSYEEVEIPGRNGTVFLYTDNYKNVEVTYKAWIAKVDDPDYVSLNYRALRSFLMSRKGYFRIEDTYHPDEIRFGVYNNAIETEMLDSLDAAQFDLVFSCKPQRYLKKYYDYSVDCTASSTPFYNDTYFNAYPLLRVYGTGTFTINGTSIKINSANSYTDIDCELQEAYKNTLATNCNGNITLTNGKFPFLKPGDNSIVRGSGITRIVMTPRLFML